MNAESIFQPEEAPKVLDDKKKPHHKRNSKTLFGYIQYLGHISVFGKNMVSHHLH